MSKDSTLNLRSRWAEPLIDLFYPRSCILTGEPLGEGDYLYLTDWVIHRLPLIKDPRCPVCGHPFFGEVEEGPICHHCESLHPVFDQGRCGYLLSRDTRILLHSFKYRKKRYLAPDIAKLLSRSPGFFEFLKNSTIVPVPLHPRKERKRGFNQTDEILKHLEPLAPDGLNVLPLLRRNREADSQTRANRKERLKQIRGAFGIDPKVEMPSQQKRCVIFDDVFTTGATLNTCAAVLKAAGFEQIDVAAFAHG